MKKLTLIIVILFSGVLFMTSCSTKYKEHREMILKNVQTIDDGSILDLNAEIINIEYDTIITTQDSLDMYLVNWNFRLDSLATKWEQEIDSIDLIMDSLFNICGPDGSGYDKDEGYWTPAGKKASDEWLSQKSTRDINEMGVLKIKISLLKEVPFIEGDDPFTYKNELKESNALYHVYKCTYKALNPMLQVDQTITKHFVFNENQTKIIRKY